MRKLICAVVLALIATSASALDTTELLSTIALPLAVAAVSDVAGVPQDQLGNFVATLLNANVPTTQIIELVRYVPVALVEEGAPFVEFVQQQSTGGTSGSALVPVVVDRLQPYYPSTQITVTAPAVANATPVIVDDNFVPQVVVTRVAEGRKHPHGGPPGQLKKQLGVQTGAEVVHGEARKEKKEKKEVRVVQPPPQRVVTPVVIAPEAHGKGHDKGNDKGNDKGHDNGQGHGKGKGKGKG